MVVVEVPVVSFWVSDDVYRKLREKAEAMGLTLSEYARRQVVKDIDVTSMTPSMEPSMTTIDVTSMEKLGKLEAELDALKEALAIMESRLRELEEKISVIPEINRRLSHLESTITAKPGQEQSEERGKSRCPTEKVHVKPLDEVRNVESYIRWLREKCGYDEVNEDADVTYKGRRVRAIVATTREYMDEVVRTLNERGSEPDQLAGYHKILYEAGLIYYDAKKGWVTVG
jgi:vacuolar-type H+-ATPase subunit I/STV1